MMNEEGSLGNFAAGQSVNASVSAAEVATEDFGVQPVCAQVLEHLLHTEERRARALRGREHNDFDLFKLTTRNFDSASARRNGLTGIRVLTGPGRARAWRAAVAASWTSDRNGSQAM